VLSVVCFAFCVFGVWAVWDANDNYALALFQNADWLFSWPQSAGPMLVLRHAQGLDAQERILLWHEMGGNVQNGGPLSRLLWRTDEGRRERLEALALGG
jgi:hypothetical protein